MFVGDAYYYSECARLSKEDDRYQQKYLVGLSIQGFLLPHIAKGKQPPKITSIIGEHPALARMKKKPVQTDAELKANIAKTGIVGWEK